MKSSAIFSKSRAHRYRLTRVWDYSLRGVTWIMLNPSVADAEQDDPTIRRCVGFSKQWGYGRLDVVNLFSYVATDPRELLKTGLEIYNSKTDKFILKRCKKAQLVICAWGARGNLKNRSNQVHNMLVSHNIKLYCLGLTAEGLPRHPLYTPGNVPLMRWL